MLEVNDFDAVRIALASPEQIRSWSYGEVTKPETINYRTLKPERDGLFCERIFGPTKDYECFCGKYKKIRYKGVICDKCGVEVTQARVRRERMGHIELASPVAHIWFARGIPSRIGLLLNLSPRNLERVLYFSHFIVISVNNEAREAAIAQATQNGNTEFAAKQAALDAQIAEMEKNGASVEEINQLRRNFGDEKNKIDEKVAHELDQLKGLEKGKLLSENECQDLSDKYSQVFKAGMGADAILEIIKSINLDELRSQLIQEVQTTSGQRRKKASKQLRLVESFRHSGNKPEWMIISVLPVLPPDLRPLVQLDGGRLATSDLNDLYRRVINRNNRLRHLLEIGAPEIIIRNEKRMLQEAVDSLIDNGKRGRAVSVSGNHKLKSLSDVLHGKQGRFRQNLLGKRVDYSGRSVIVVGPQLKLNQCGLPKQMALELFKPFVMRHLVKQGLAHNIKSARRLVERAKPEVYDMLEEVIQSWPVLLNRAPTLHRLGIQAFEPVLIDDSAIQIHPLVCSAFNADFDGDQMAVHVPLSKSAVKEAREVMLSIHNMLLPSSGEPVVAPTLDMVMGCFYLTSIKKGAKGEGMRFGSFEEAKLLCDLGIVELRAEIIVPDLKNPGQKMKTSVGRIIFNDILPEQLRFMNKETTKSDLKQIVAECYKLLTHEETAKVLDSMKDLGFKYATRSGTTVALNDIEVPPSKPKILQQAEERISILENQYHRGLITEEERYQGVVAVWMETTEKITDVIAKSLDRYGGLYMMATSGAKGNISQIRQMAGMRGLMTDPSGRIIDFPIKSSLREGHTVLEYFISTHGARKGLADTALRTSDSGYLTRRLIDASQDVIILEEDCETTDGMWFLEAAERGILPSLQERINGRYAAADVADPQTGEIIVSRNEEIDEIKAKAIIAAGIKQVYVRTPITCQSRRGCCQKCYGRDLATRKLVAINTAVGIVAAQSIGEPGTQLTLRTFHTGGVVGLDITSGLPRVEELFEARMPKSPALVSEIDGTVQYIQDDTGRRFKVTSSETFRDEYPLQTGWDVKVKDGQRVDIGTLLAAPAGKTSKSKEVSEENQPLTARVAGEVKVLKKNLVITYEEREEREYTAPSPSHILVRPGDKVKAGQQLTEGTINPQDLLHILGREAAQHYLVDEVQKVYRSQGVNINEKHIEIIVRQMLSKVRIDSSGDTELVPGELIDKYNYEDINSKVLAEGGEPATAHTVLLGVTRASLNTDSWLAAASFQETTRVLTEAAISSKEDHLIGLKENVIIGKLIPAQHTLSIDKIEPPAQPQLVGAAVAAAPAGQIPAAATEPAEDNTQAEPGDPEK